MRPTLVDYLLVLEHEHLDMQLILHVGALEVGSVGVKAGLVISAELPGARGELALELLAKLPSVRVSPERWRERQPNVERAWRDVLDTDLQHQRVGRSQRFTMIRAELRELEAERADESGVYFIGPSETNRGDNRAQRIIAELFDWGIVDAYLTGEIEAARALAERREQLGLAQLHSAANLERLRLRLLEDELAASVAEVGE